MPRTVAVICAFWPSRLDNINRIITDLRNGTRVPDRILVLNNNKDLNLSFEGAEVINSQYNARTRGKFPIGLLDAADYYLFLDDDTSVGSRTLEKFLQNAHRDCCYGYCGVFYEKGNGYRIYPHEITEETPVQYFLGCGLFMSFYAVLRYLMLDEQVRLSSQWKHEAEDILIGLANKATILPLSEDERFVDLTWGTEAMSWGHDGTSLGGGDYLRMRDEVTVFAMDKLKERPIKDF